MYMKCITIEELANRIRDCNPPASIHVWIDDQGANINHIYLWDGNRNKYVSKYYGNEEELTFEKLVAANSIKYNSEEPQKVVTVDELMELMKIHRPSYISIKDEDGFTSVYNLSFGEYRNGDDYLSLIDVFEAKEIKVSKE